jgi:hypothetical protein
MLSVLVKNCAENIYLVKGMRGVLNMYHSSEVKDVKIRHKIPYILDIVERFEE